MGLAQAKKWICGHAYSVLGFGVLGKEVYIGSIIDQEGNFGVYLPERSYVGNSKVLCERDLLVSCESGWFRPLVSFPVLRWLAINKLTKQC